jgi:hypothetical protein
MPLNGRREKNTMSVYRGLEFSEGCQGKTLLLVNSGTNYDKLKKLEKNKSYYITNGRG